LATYLTFDHYPKFIFFDIFLV